MTLDICFHLPVSLSHSVSLCPTRASNMGMEYGRKLKFSGHIHLNNCNGLTTATVTEDAALA